MCVFCPQRKCGKLKAKNASLEEQLETATEIGIELNRLLSEFLTSQSENDRLQEVTSTLQQQLEEQKEDISNLQLTTDASFQEVIF